MNRSPMLTRHLLLFGCAATCLFAATSVPASAPPRSSVRSATEARLLASERERARIAKVYHEILTCPSDDPGRATVPTEYVICAGVRDSASDPLLIGGAPPDTVVFPDSNPTSVDGGK